MRGIVVLVVAVVAISTATRDRPHSVLRPTKPIPAVNVP
jgi:hypothetical protein